MISKNLIKISFILALYFISSVSLGQSITNIDANFCNDGKITKELSFITDSAKINEICVQFSNNHTKDISITVGFPDGAVTNDEYKNKACKAEGNIQNFGQYVVQKNKTLKIPAGKTITEKSYIKFPAGFSGIVNGCMTYFVNQLDQDLDNPVNIVVRKTKNIDILVGSNFKREILINTLPKVNFFGSNKNFNIKIDPNSDLILEMSISNNGDIDEFFSGSGTIYDNFGFSKDFEIYKTRLPANSDKIISTKIGKIPFYGGFLQIDIFGIVQAEILFNKDSLDPQLKQDIQISQKTKIFIFPGKVVFSVLIFLIILIYLIVRIYKKNRPSK